MTTRRRRSRAGAPKFQHRLPRHVQQLRSKDWPEADRARWLRAQVRDDPFDEAGRLADLAPRTVETLEESYGQFLAWLGSENALDPGESIEQRITPDRIGCFILNLRERLRASTIDARLTHIKLVACALAPDVDWKWIMRHPLAPSTREIRASRKPIKTVDVQAILAQGLKLIADTEGRSDLNAALGFRNGMLLLFQSIFTFRLENLAEITIGIHLVRRGRRWFLQFQESVKNKGELDYEVPPMLAVPLDTYLTMFRPILLGNALDHRHLWICDDGEPMRPGGVNAVFRHLCRTPDGEKLTTHPFRHAKATAFMLRNPGDLDLAAAALGHSGVSSVNQVYDRSGGLGASRAWNTIMKRRFGRCFDDETES